jgi:hypothetical protein
VPGRRLLSLIVVAGCLCAPVACGDGGGGDKGGKAGDGAAEETAVLTAIDEFYMAFTHARPAKACAQMTPALRRSFTRIVVKALPSLKGKNCRRVYMPFYSRVPPENAPRAIELAAGPEYPAVSIAGDRATATYKEGGEIRLQRVDGRWLIAAAELLPSPVPGEPG